MPQSNAKPAGPISSGLGYVFLIGAERPCALAEPSQTAPQVPIIPYSAKGLKLAAPLVRIDL
jgi:hypothetical protein